MVQGTGGGEDRRGCPWEFRTGHDRQTTAPEIRSPRALGIGRAKPYGANNSPSAVNTAV